jgi:uncharacterized membrane protein
MENPKNPSDETIDMWQKDPYNWKLGLFYFNTNDKRVFVSKRISILGMTFNFANPISYLIVFALIVTICSYINKQ